jgi:hypothetical protein
VLLKLEQNMFDQMAEVLKNGPDADVLMIVPPRVVPKAQEVHADITGHHHVTLTGEQSGKRSTRFVSASRAQPRLVHRLPVQPAGAGLRPRHGRAAGRQLTFQEVFL